MLHTTMLNSGRTEVIYIKSIVSDVFIGTFASQRLLRIVVPNRLEVHAAKSFPGMSESTFLSRSFGDQGVRLRIRKETRSLL